MGAFKLGKMTFGSLFKKPETVKYPFETKPQPAGLKGHIVIDENSCILCGMCERSCTTDCILVDKSAHTWSINRYQCIQCGYCITVCPKKCMSMDPNYAPAAAVIQRDSITVPEKGKASAEKKAEKPAQAKAAEPKPAAKEQEAPKPEPKEEARDEQVVRLIALMDPEKAKVVESALNK